jgi:hypothetical protein
MILNEFSHNLLRSILFSLRYCKIIGVCELKGDLETLFIRFYE